MLQRVQCSSIQTFRLAYYSYMDSYDETWVFEQRFTEQDYAMIVALRMHPRRQHNTFSRYP